MKKNIFAVALAIAVTAVLFTGCGESGEHEVTGETEEAAGREEQGDRESGAAADNEEGEAVGAKELKLVCKEIVYDAFDRVTEQLEREYRESGTLLRETCFKGYSKVEEREYDESGNPLRETCFDEGGGVTGWSEWKYDADGRLSEKIIYFTDGTVRSMEKYDAFGRLAEERGFWSSGRGAGMHRYEYDAAGNLTKEEQCSSDGTYVNGWNEFDYDASGNQIRQSQYNNEGKRKKWTSYEYDASGNLIRKIHHSTGDDSITAQERYEYQYDEKGNIVSATHYMLSKDGEWNVSSTQRNEYDSAGNLTKETYYSGQDSVIKRHEYEYITIVPQADTAQPDLPEESVESREESVAVIPEESSDDTEEQIENLGGIVDGIVYEEAYLGEMKFDSSKYYRLGIPESVYDTRDIKARTKSFLGEQYAEYEGILKEIEENYEEYFSGLEYDWCWTYNKSDEYYIHSGDFMDSTLEQVLNADTLKFDVISTPTEKYYYNFYNDSEAVAIAFFQNYYVVYEVCLENEEKLLVVVDYTYTPFPFETEYVTFRGILGGVLRVYMDNANYQNINGWHVIFSKNDPGHFLDREGNDYSGQDIADMSGIIIDWP